MKVKSFFVIFLFFIIMFTYGCTQSTSGAGEVATEEELESANSPGLYLSTLSIPYKILKPRASISASISLKNTGEFIARNIRAQIFAGSDLDIINTGEEIIPEILKQGQRTLTWQIKRDVEGSKISQRFVGAKLFYKYNATGFSSVTLTPPAYTQDVFAQKSSSQSPLIVDLDISPNPASLVNEDSEYHEFTINYKVTNQYTGSVCYHSDDGIQDNYLEYIKIKVNPDWEVYVLNKTYGLVSLEEVGVVEDMGFEKSLNPDFDTYILYYDNAKAHDEYFSQQPVEERDGIHLLSKLVLRGAREASGRFEVRAPKVSEVTEEFIHFETYYGYCENAKSVPIELAD